MGGQTCFSYGNSISLSSTDCKLNQHQGICRGRGFIYTCMYVCICTVYIDIRSGISLVWVWLKF